MKKPKKALATLVLLGAAALVLCSSVGDKVPPRAAADTSPRAAEAPLAFRAPLPPDSNVTLTAHATRADERVPTRAPQASPSARGHRIGGVARRAATEKAQLIHSASTAPTAPSEVPAAEPATEIPPVRAPVQPPLAKPSGLAVGQFRDQTGPSYVLSRVTCLIDGRTVYSGPGGKSLQLFQRTLVPGNHTVTVQADYRMKNVGPFSYPKGFQFKVTSGRRFNVAASKPVRVSVVGYEKGGPTRAFDERLALAIRAS